PAYEQYLQQTGNSEKANVMAHISAVLEVTSESFLPDVKIADMAMKGLKDKTVSSIVDLVNKGGDPAVLAEKSASVFTDFMKQAAKFGTKTLEIAATESMEEVYSNTGGFLSQMVFDPNSAVDRDITEESWETIR